MWRVLQSVLRHVLYHIDIVYPLTSAFFATREFSSLLRSSLAEKITGWVLAGNGGVNGIMLYSMVAAVLVKKPVMVGKVASGACSFEATSRFSRVQISRS